MLAESIKLDKNKKIRHSGLKRMEWNEFSFLFTHMWSLNHTLLRTKLFFFPTIFLKRVGGGGSREWRGSPAEICISCLELFLPPPLSKSAHTFVLCPTHFPLSFLMPTPPQRLPPPLALFLFASALRGLRERDVPRQPLPPDRHPLRSARSGAALLCISFL